MKKILMISTLALTVVSTSVFGQGYFQFTSGKSQAYDGFTTTAVSALGATINVSFLWAAASTTPNIDTLISNQSLKNGTNNQGGLGYTAQTAWSTILNGQFTFATNAATGALVTAQTSATGVISYNSGLSFGVSNTAPSTTYTVYEVAWSSAYATPWLASAANAAVGWSSPIQYATVTATGFVNPMLGQFASYGVFAPASTPEPSTLALAALGGASLLLFRRRK